jgi:hypothetical protein
VGGGSEEEKKKKKRKRRTMTASVELLRKAKRRADRV